MKIINVLFLITIVSFNDLFAQVKILSIVDSLIIEKFKGKEYDFSEYKLLSKGGWVSTVVHNDTTPDFQIDEYKRDSVYVLVLTYRKTRELHQNKILDIMAITFNHTKMLLVTKWCKCNDKSDDSIFAVVENTDTPYYENIIKAWHVDREHNRFEEISTKGIKCENMAYGD